MKLLGSLLANHSLTAPAARVVSPTVRKNPKTEVAPTGSIGYFCLYRNKRMTELTPIARKFVLHWGELGTRWGINRTMSQIHALLYLSDKALNAEEICETLDLARSNVSTSLRELQNWGIVRVVHLMGIGGITLNR